jgi:Ca2+-binding RTX toxin-like protein
MPLAGDMKIETNFLIQDSADKRGTESPEARYSTELEFPDLSDDEAWAIMVKYARLIDAADTAYELFEENSNAFIGALLEAAGLDADDPTAWLPTQVQPGEAVGLSHYDDLMTKVAPPADGALRGTSSADQITGIQVSEVIHANGGNDTVWGGRGHDQVFGGAGEDRLHGQAGCDTVSGGGGKDIMHAGADQDRDVFVFASRSESVVGAKRDVIHDFASGTDVIDLRGIDAKPATSDTDDPFAWAGKTAARNAIWWEGTGEGVLVKGDVSGDAKADLEVLLANVGAITLVDVLL